MSRDFTGSPNDVRVDADSVWSIGAGPFAASAWVYRDTTGEKAVLAKWRGTVNRTFILYIPTSNVVTLTGLTAGGSGITATKSGFTGTAWHQVGFEYDGQDGSIRVYLDGVAGTSVDTPNSPFHTSAGLNMRVGSSADDSSTRYWDGAICDVAAWSSTLSVAEWVALANGVPAGKVRPGSLISYSPLWGVGPNEPDLSGLGNLFEVNGTLNQRDHGPVGFPFPLEA